MPQNPNASPCAPVQSRGGNVKFSYWPTSNSGSRKSVQQKRYVTDPWRAIEFAIREYCASSRMEVALSFYHQAREFFVSATRAESRESVPLLYYYSFMNLGKVLMAVNTQDRVVGHMHHGLTDNETITGSGLGVRVKTSSTNVNVFESVHKALGGQPFSGDFNVSRQDLFASSLFGHRDWCKAANRKERFMGLSDIEFVENRSNKTAWTRLVLPKAKFNRLGRSQRATIQEAGLSSQYQFVQVNEARYTDFLVLESLNKVPYNGRAIDVLDDVAAPLKHLLYRSIESSEPFYRYYLNLMPQPAYRFSQVMSAYALMFKLGSMARYFPTALNNLFRDNHSGVTNEFLATYPSQIIYAFACELNKQEIITRSVI